MKLLKFEASNLFSLGQITLPLSSQGLVLVTGYSKDDKKFNGSGKSSLVNKGPTWTLFGQTVNGLRSDRVINRYRTGGKTFGKIYFKGLDGEEYVVIRQRNPFELKLLKNGEDLSRRSEKETQKLINSVLGFDFETFCHTSIYGQGISSYFITLTPKQKREVIERILPLPILDAWAEKAVFFKKITSSSISELQISIRSKEQTLRALEENLTKIVSLKDKWEQERSSTLEEYIKDLKLIKIKEKSIKDQLKKLETELESYPEPNLEKIEEYQLKIRNLQNEVDQIKEEHSKLKLELSSKEGELVKLQGLLFALDSEQKVCPTCNQPISDQVFQSLVEEQDRIKATIEQIDLSIQELKNKVKDVPNTRDKELEIKAIFSLISKLQSDARARTELENKIIALKKQNTTDSEIIAQKISMLRNEKNPYLDQEQDLKNQISSLSKEIENLTKKIKLLETEHEHLSFWEKAYSKTLKEKAISSACPFLTERTKYHLAQLNNSQFLINFTLRKELASGAVKEEFNVNVESTTGGEGFDSLSGGEQSIVNFAIGLAISDLANLQVSQGSNVLILDEPFAELDRVNCENVVNYLTGRLLKEKDTIFLISNDTSLQSLIPNQIKLIKSQGVTSYADDSK